MLGFIEKLNIQDLTPSRIYAAGRRIYIVEAASRRLPLACPYTLRTPSLLQRQEIPPAAAKEGVCKGELRVETRGEKKSPRVFMLPMEVRGLQ
jgi:hypothetical protein